MNIFIKNILIILLLNIGCTKAFKPPPIKLPPMPDKPYEVPIAIPMEPPEYYFHFDEVDYFSHSKEEGVTEAINGKESNEILQLKHDFLSWKVPNELTDTLYIIRLEEFDFDKEKIETEKFDTLRDIFQYKKHTDFFSAHCLPTYNDILIFKNKGEIIGIAKICFGCDQHHFVGTDLDDSDFGQSGDYNRLYKLLKGIEIYNSHKLKKK